MNIEKNLIIKEAEEKIKYYIEEINNICDYNQEKVLNAFIKNKISATDFS